MFKFKVGDVVKLNSGGPLMTVSHVTDLGDVPLYDTVWFDSTGTLQGNSFYEIVLEKVE